MSVPLPRRRLSGGQRWCRVGRVQDVRRYQDQKLGPLLPLARDALLACDARVREFLDPRGVADVVEDHARGRDDRGYQLWALLMLELWLRRIVGA